MRAFLLSTVIVVVVVVVVVVHIVVVFLVVSPFGFVSPSFVVVVVVVFLLVVYQFQVVGCSELCVLEFLIPSSCFFCGFDCFLL